MKVARVLARKLKLDRDCESIFVKAVVEPDRWRRKRPRRVKHHYLRDYAIINRLVSARLHYLSGDIFSCLWNLGIALHFIQDAYVPSPRTRRLQSIHALIEQRSRSISLDYIEAEVDKAFYIGSASYESVVEIVLQIRWVYDADQAIREAIRASAMLTAAVFSSKEPPEDLVTNYSIARERFEREKSKAEKRLLVILGISIVLSIALGFAVDATLALALILLSLILTGVAYGTIPSDPEYSRLKKEAIWYGLTE